MRAKRDIIPIFVPHSGCQNACVFCNQRKITGNLNPANAGLVKKTITEAFNKWPDKTFELAFYGGSFTAIPENIRLELLLAAYEFVLNGFLDSVRISTRPDCVDLGKLKQLKQYGVKTIELGIQSMDEDVLLRSGRGHTADDSIRAMGLVKVNGFTLIAQMMTGLPGDSREKTLMSAQRIIAEKPDGVRIYPVVVIKDTELYEMFKRGEYEPLSVDAAVSICAELISLFEENGINVLRTGLNPSDELSGGEVVAGAYHPAFGELVHNKIYFDRSVKLIENFNSVRSVRQLKSVVLGVNRSCISLMTGQKRCNIDKLKLLFGFESVSVRQTDVSSGEIVILDAVF